MSDTTRQFTGLLSGNDAPGLLNERPWRSLSDLATYLSPSNTGWAPWPVRAVRSGLAALAAPGDAYAGRLPMMDDSGHTSAEAVGRSADLAGLMTLGATGAPRGALGSGAVLPPTRAYHGTRSKFDNFDPDASRSAVEGSWFSDSRPYADWISSGGSGKKTNDSRTLEVDLNIQNPRVVDILDEGRRVASEAGVPPPRTEMEAQGILSGSMGWNRVVADMVEEARGAGHDALVLKNFDDGFPGKISTAYVVWTPELIKFVKTYGIAAAVGAGLISKEAAQGLGQDKL